MRRISFGFKKSVGMVSRHRFHHRAALGALLLVINSAAFGASAHAAEQRTADKQIAAPVELDNSATFAMTSRVNGRTYQIFVAQPAAPAPASGYPVIYMTDANARFATMVETARAWARGQRQETENAIIVGIGYPPGVNAGKERSLDLTPSLDEMPTPEGYGGADSFLKFILDELKPHIEQAYAVDRSQQALFGHSFGGLFALHALFNQPDAFQAYLVASPSIWWGERFALKELPRLTPKLSTTGAAVRVLVTVGELEQTDEPASPPPAGRPILPGVIGRTQVDDAEKMAAALAGTPGVAASYVLFDGEQHGTVPPAAISRSVTYLFESRAPAPAPKPSDLAGKTTVPVPTADEYIAMTAEERYALRIKVRGWPDEERRRFLSQLKFNLEAGLWYSEQQALHEERNRMDQKYGTRPVE